MSKWDSILYQMDTMTGKNKEFINYSPDHFDTSGITSMPIQILSKEFIIFKKEYDIKEEFILIKYKNISQKTITGVKLRWFCEDGFGEPKLMMSDLGSLSMSIGEDRNGDRLKPGETGEIKCKQFYDTGDRIISAWAYQVGFEDQTIWKIH